MAGARPKHVVIVSLQRFGVDVTQLLQLGLRRHAPIDNAKTY